MCNANFEQKATRHCDSSNQFLITCSNEVYGGVVMELILYELRFYDAVNFMCLQGTNENTLVQGPHSYTVRILFICICVRE